MRHRFGAALLVFVSFGLAAPADAGKLGQEFRVNTEKGGDQEAPAVAGLSNGDFVIVWKNFGQSGNLGGMYFQRYSAGGTKLGGETRVNSNGTTVQFAPSVAALENGRFVVVWTSPDDGSGSGVYMQRYDADGLPLGKAKRCNTFTTGNQAMPSVSALSNGGYIVAWRSSGQDGSGTGIYGQRFDSFGTKVGAGFRLNTNTFLDQTHPRVAGLDNGGFVGAWNSDNQDGDGYGIYAQRYLSNGAKTGLEFRANSETSSMQFGAAIAALTNSRSVIVWYSFGQDGSGFGVYAQRYAKTGAENGGEFRATVSTAGDQLNPAVAGLSNGGLSSSGKPPTRTVTKRRSLRANTSPTERPMAANSGSTPSPPMIRSRRPSPRSGTAASWWSGFRSTRTAPAMGSMPSALARNGRPPAPARKITRCCGVEPGDGTFQFGRPLPHITTCGSLA